MTIDDDGDGFDNVFPFTPSGASDSRRSPKPVIRLTDNAFSQTAIEIENAIVAAHLPVYAYASHLVYPAETEVDGPDGSHVRMVRLVPFTVPLLRQFMDKAALFEKFDGRTKKWKLTRPPADIAELILRRFGFWPFPAVVGVTTAPTINSDGDILAEAGVEPHSRLLLGGLPPLPADMPDQPTRADALRSIAVLEDLFSEYAFTDESSKSVALSMLISPLCRGCVSQLPLHAVNAPAPGSGKSYLAKIAAAILTGRACPAIPPAPREEEFEKRLIGAMLSGAPIICLDNITGTLGNATLCQAIEQPIVEVRMLGGSELIAVEQRTAFFANGNNLTIAADLTRRTLMVSLDRNEERPELHVYEHAPFEQVLANRGEYIAHCLTIVRAYILAGRPAKLSPFLSFDQWSDNIRSALVWLGRADPCDSVEVITANDPDRQQREAILSAWPEFETEYTVAELIAIAAAERADKKRKVEERTDFGSAAVFEEPPLWVALKEAAGDGKQSIDSRKLSWYFRQHLLNRVVTIQREENGENLIFQAKLLKGRKKHQAVTWVLSSH